MALNLNKDNFEQSISSGVALVDFWAEWCGPCKMQLPIIEEFSSEMEGKATIGKVNVDEELELAQSFGIQSIPTLILFKDGKPVKKLVGLFKYYPYSIVRSSKYVNFIESAKTKSDVFEFLNIGQKKELTVTDSNTFVVLCYKETKPDYTKNIIKLNIDKNNFSQRINNIAMFNYSIRGVVLTTDDVYNPESKHNVYISNSEQYTTEEFPKEIVIDVAGKQNYNIFYLVNVELSVNPGSFAGVGDFELTLNKGFLSY